MQPAHFLTLGSISPFHHSVLPSLPHIIVSLKSKSVILDTLMVHWYLLWFARYTQLISKSSLSASHLDLRKEESWKWIKCIVLYPWPYTKKKPGFFLFLIGRKLLYNVVLIAAVQQCQSVIIAHMCVYIYIPSLLNLPPLPYSIPLGHYRAPDWAPCVI